jgi:hypothetical protein
LPQVQGKPPRYGHAARRPTGARRRHLRDLRPRRPPRDDPGSARLPALIGQQVELAYSRIDADRGNECASRRGRCRPTVVRRSRSVSPRPRGDLLTPYLRGISSEMSRK